MVDKTKDAAPSDKPKGKRGKLLMIALIAVLVLGGGGGAAAYFMGMFGEAKAASPPADAAAPDEGHGAEEAVDAVEAEHGDGHEAGEVKAPPVPKIIFVDLPDVLVNLNSDTRRMRFLKLRVAVETSSKPVADAVQQLTPRIIDSFQLYLRGLTVDELSGPSALHRLKQEMLARINLALDPDRIDDVLFKEMLVQ